jgi:hypothetical protein
MPAKVPSLFYQTKLEEKIGKKLGELCKPVVPGLSLKQ